MCALLSADLFTITHILMLDKGDYFGNNVTSSDQLFHVHKMLKKSFWLEIRKVNSCIRNPPKKPNFPKSVWRVKKKKKKKDGSSKPLYQNLAKNISRNFLNLKDFFRKTTQQPFKRTNEIRSHCLQWNAAWVFTVLLLSMTHQSRLGGGKGRWGCVSVEKKSVAAADKGKW